VTGSSKPALDHCLLTPAGGSPVCRNPARGWRHRRRRLRKAPDLRRGSPDAPAPSGDAATRAPARSASDTRSTRRRRPRSIGQVSERRTSVRFTGSQKVGSRNGLRSLCHSPNLAHSRRASIQSASSAISETGSRPRKGGRFRKGQRRLSAVTGRSLTLSP
jgi:hypothetical protein